MNGSPWVNSLLLAFTLAATVCDLAREKIYNWLVYPGILVAILSNSLIPGGRGLQDSLWGLGVCGGIMVCAVALNFAVGGGDVKLIGMMGAYLGLTAGFEAMVWTFVIGAVLGVAVLVWRVGAAELIRRTFRHVAVTWRYRQFVPLSEDERAQLRAPLRLAPAALLAELIVVFNLMERLA